MKLLKTQKLSIVLAAIMMIIAALSGCSSQLKDQSIHVKVLILPKFELDDIAGDFPGEAQYFYEEYLAGGDVYEIDGCAEENKL